MIGKSTKELTFLGQMSRRGVIWAAFLVVLAGAQTASATAINLQLSDFTIFSNTATNFAGANYISGNIGSNGDVINGAGDTQVLGSIYAGGDFSTGQNTKIGSDGITAGPDQEWPPFDTSPVYSALTAQVVANGTATLGSASTIYGTLDANSYTLNGTAAVTGTKTAPSTTTFGTIAMTSGVGFTANGIDQSCSGSGCTSLTLATNTYGTLTTGQGKIVNLVSGNYYFDSLSIGGTNTFKIDLTSGAPININIVEGATFGQDAVLMVKGAGTNGLYVPISEAPQLAALINWTLGGRFDLGGGNATAWTTIFGGIVDSHYSGTGNGISFGQHIDWYGALYAYDTISLLDHSRYNYWMVPEPGSLTLFGLGLIGFAVVRRRKESCRAVTLDSPQASAC